MALLQAIVKALTGRKSEAKAADTLENESSWDPSKSWYGSEEEELEERAQEQIWESLEEMMAVLRMPNSLLKNCMSPAMAAHS